MKEAFTCDRLIVFFPNVIFVVDLALLFKDWSTEGLVGSIAALFEGLQH